MKKRNLKKPIISALEQRILFDGAAVATAVDVLDNSSFTSSEPSSSTSNNDATSNSAENSVHEVQAVQGFERDRREVAFVDVTVKDYQTLVDGVNEGVEVYLVSSLDEIKTTLSSQTNIDAIHILSHGNTGEISVGNDVLNSNTLDDNAQLLETMKNSLSVDGDILLYGCNVASDGRGQEFINSIATLTQADVAASEDTTGNSALGGDWELEKSSGSIETDNFEIMAYDSILSVTTFELDITASDYFHRPNLKGDISGAIADYESVNNTNEIISYNTGSNSLPSTNFNYVTVTLTPSMTGNYSVLVTSATGVAIDSSHSNPDTAIFLYDTSFNSSSPLTNILYGNDDITTFSDDVNGDSVYDSPANFLSHLDNISLLAGHTYILVVTTFQQGVTGHATVDISGPGSVGVSGSTVTSAPSDTTPPTFDVTPATSNVTATTVDLSASLDEAGKIYYVVVADGATAPSIAQIKAGQDSTGASALKSGNSDVATTQFTGTYNITGLSANTAYDIYVVGQDDGGTPNVMVNATKIDVTTAIGNSTPDVISMGSGHIVLQPEAYTSGAKAIFEQSDGKILVVGSSQPDSSTKNIYVQSLNSDGTIDTSFGGGDGVTTISNPTARNFNIYGATKQSDGKIIVSGASYDGSYTNVDFALLRINTDGTLDTTFGTNGYTITDMGSDSDFSVSVVVDSNGNIIVGGQHKTISSTFDFAVARYTSSGVLDTSFSGDGKAFVSASGFDYTNFTSLTIQSDNKILVTGYANNSGSFSQFALARLNTDGTLDSTFGTNGVVTTDIGSSNDQALSVSVGTDGKIVVAGLAYNNNPSGGWDVALARYTSSGVLDTTFSGDGKLITQITGTDASRAEGVQVLSDGKIIVRGLAENFSTWDNDFLVLKYNVDGSLDTTFSNDGISTTNFGFYSDITNAMTVQSDGKILVAGLSGSTDSTTKTAIVRLNADGTQDSTFGKLTYTLGDDPLVLNAQALDSELSDAPDFTNDNYNGAVLTLSRQGGSNSNDVFSATGTLGSISALSGNIVVGGTTVGTYTNNAGSLVITFNSSSTTTNVSQVMEQIAYKNVGNTTQTVNLLWSFNDGNTGAQGSDGAKTGTAISTVYVENAVDITPPTFDITPATSNITATTLDLSASLNEAGKIYYVVVPNGSTAPSVAQIKAGQDSTGSSALKSGNSDVTTTPFIGTYNITGLSANTAYDIYVVGQDDEGTPNVMASATKVDVTTPHALITFESGNGVLSSDNSISMTYSHTGTSTTFTITAKDTSDQQGHLKYGSVVGDPAGHIGSESIYAIDEGKANSITFSVENGKTFDLISFYLSNQNGNGDETFTITTNKGGSSTGISGADNNIDSDKIILPSTALFQGITSFTITAPSGGAFMEIDDIVLQNIMVVADSTPPTFDVAPATSNVTATTVDLSASLDEAGKIYYVVVADGATAPSVAQILAGQDSTGSAALKSGNSDLTATPFTETYNITGLTANTAYDIYVVGQDDEGTPNVMVNATKVDVTMAGLPPVFSSSSTTNFAENTTGTVYDAELSSSTGTVTYTLSGTDSGKFNINSTTGILTFKSAPDYETPTDNGTNNVYNVTIRATDNNGYTDQNVAISVTNANDVNFTIADISNISSESLIKSVTAGSTANITFSAGAFLNVYAPNENAGFPGGLYAYTGIDSEQELIITAQTGYTFDLTSFKFAPDLSQNTTSVKVKFTSGGVSYEDTYSLTVDGTVGYNLIIPSTHPVNDVTEVRIWALAYGEFQDIEITDIKPMGPSVTAVTGTYTDTAANDTGFDNTSGTISATPSSGSITGYGISTGTTGGSTVIGGVIYDVSKAGTYGTLYVVSTGVDKGKYVYVPTSDSVINATTSTVTDVFTIQATDSNGTGNGILTITINGVNDAPTVANVIVDQIATEDSVYNYQFASNVFADVDATDTLTYTAQLVDSTGNLVNSGTLPSWLTFTAGTRTFSGTPTNSDVGSIYVKVTATDGSNSTISDTFALTVNNTNDAPTVANVIVDQIATEDSVYNYQFASNVFADVDATDTLTYTAQLVDSTGNLVNSGTLPSWLTFTAGTRTFSGTPTNSDVGSIYVKVTATDGSNSTISDTFALTVNNTNDAPTVANVIVDQIATEDSVYNYQFASNVFADVDATDTLTYTAQLVDSTGNLVNSGTLPSWLTFTAGTRTFSGTPTNSDVGSIYVKVTATDGSNSTISDTFALTVNNTNDAPIGSVTISGIPTQGETLIATNNITDADGMGTVSYQWYADGVLIDGAINSTYTLTQNEVNKAITVKASYTDTLNTVEEVTSSATADVLNVNDEPAGTVTISGTVAQGQTLTASNNITDVDGLGTISYQWYADGVLISGATNSTYTLTQNEVNKNITVVASYTDGQNTVETLTSNATTSVVNVNDAPVGTVTISGTPTQGETLTATNNITDADGMGTISYQWYADGVLINGATNSTYTLTQNEVNRNITVVASYTDGFGANETVTSSATIDVVNVNDAPTVSSNNIDVELGFGDSYTKDISVLFNDIDSDNVFTYEAVNLPLGLSIDPITGVISGSANSSGEFIITIKATDNGTPPLSISRTYKMIVVAPAQVEVPQPSPSETPTNNTPTVIVPPIVVTTFADTLSLGTINNNLGNEVADNVGTGYLNNNGLNPQETTNPRNNNSDNQAQTASTNRNNNGNYIEADANLNVNANGQVTFDRATQDSFSTVGIAIEDMTIENNRLEIKVVDTSVAQNFVVTKTDGTSLPTGLSFDPRTGSISGTVPENLDKLDITIKATNPDGTTRVLNIKIDLKKLKEANRADGEKYIGLKDQLAVESQKLEGYGNYLVSLFA